MRRAVASLAAILILALPGCVTTQVDPGAQAAPRPDPLPAVTLEAIAFQTDLGDFTAILYEEDAPETVALMKELVGAGYYDGREFGRVIPGFVIQEVDRAGGVTDQTKTVALEAGKRSMFSAGAMGTARGEDPHSGGSEFFVMDFAISHLYGNYTVWGQVVTGLDVVRKIARVQAAELPGPPAPVPWPLMDRVPVSPVKIKKATLASLELSGDEFSLLPLRVAPTVRSADGYRYTLEYPSNLTAFPLDGLKTLSPRFGSMTWYSWARAKEAKPHDPQNLAVRVRDSAGVETVIRPEADAADPGILHWWWQPPAPGAYNITLMKGPKELAWADLQAP